MKAKIVFRELGETEELLVTPLDSNRYRVGMTSFAKPDARYGAVIEAIPQKDGSLLFQRIAEPSPFQTYSYVVSEKYKQSTEFKTLLNRVHEKGGEWEIAYGGIFIIHLPKNCDLDPNAEMTHE